MGVFVSSFPIETTMSENTNSSEVVIEEINEETIERSIEKANSFKEEGNKCSFATNCDV